jgi:hypothetical protein
MKKQYAGLVSNLRLIYASTPYWLVGERIRERLDQEGEG